MTTFNTSRRSFLATTGLTGLALAAGAQAAPVASGKQPNIVYIMADDMGYADLSCFGAQGYTTPVLDGLAAQGLKLRHAYANAPICSPTRTALVTGRYQGRFRAGLNEPNVGFTPGMELPKGTPTVASMLRDAGYRTAFVGKWHVCKVPEFSPFHYGYDSFFGIAGGGADYFIHTAIRNGAPVEGDLRDGDKEIHREGYLTDILADEAIKQIKAGGDKPLFLSLHFNAPHWPWEGPEDAAHAHTLKDMRDPSGGSLETYAKMMVSMDANIGRVLAALEQAGMSENTLVVFTSDNGGERYSNTWPLTGYKGELLEGGIRVPMIVRWPGHIAPASVSDQVVISMDTVPTFLAAAKAPPPVSDGLNLLPQWTGQAPSVSRTLFWRMKASDQAAVREGNWKYLRLGGKEHLFDVARDPRERAELGPLYPERLAAMRAQWEAWNATMLPYPPDSYSEPTSAFYADRFPAPPKGTADPVAGKGA
ncbi:sulfatase family protein [Novosphingobium terrae]|uniref:sulfatase family protein n=1 Tax=Novosphingobium terrae TaxID=2726189 RepID=UPI00197E2868|nr:sulfatase-like hydrolase/transferase [Novosphingobium terrae]